MMTDNSGPSQDAEPPVPVYGPTPNPDQDPPSVPSNVHVLPCTNPPVKYFDRLDGCATGIHVTHEDTQDLHVLCRRLVDVIMAKDQSHKQATPEPCAVCKATILLGPTSPMLYMENCAHYFHYGCLMNVPTRGIDQMLDCPRCGASSTRTLLWPQVFPTPCEPAKSKCFQLQKRSFRLEVAAKTVWQVDNCYVDAKGHTAFELNAKGKYLLVCKRPPQGGERPADWRVMSEPTGGQPNLKVTEAYLVQVIQRLHLADQPKLFYLGDILPLEENVQFQAEYGLQPPLSDLTKRQKLLLQFRCPFVRQDGPNGVRCSQGLECEFWHGWPKDTPAFIVERVKIRDFPRFFCMQNTRKPATKCSERIRVHPQELVRCSAGIHPSTQDLQNMNEFAHKLAKHIMAPVVVPEESLFCAYCKEGPEPDSVWVHMYKCAHWFHAKCFPLARQINSNRKLELHCPKCWIASVRTIAWPGPFPSDMAKQAIFTRQLAEFKLTVQADTKLAIVEVPNRVNVFTLDYGGPSVITIDFATVRNRETIWYD